jgi:hypothetical protein
VPATLDGPLEVVLGVRHQPPRRCPIDESSSRRNRPIEVVPSPTDTMDPASRPVSHIRPEVSPSCRTRCAPSDPWHANELDPWVGHRRRGSPVTGPDSPPVLGSDPGGRGGAITLPGGESGPGFLIEGAVAGMGLKHRAVPGWAPAGESRDVSGRSVLGPRGHTDPPEAALLRPAVAPWGPARPLHPPYSPGGQRSKSGPSSGRHTPRPDGAATHPPMPPQFGRQHSPL